MGKLVVVVGGQYGSEGKGAVTAALARKEWKTADEHVMMIRVAGPNAGHTAYDDQGQKWALRQIPVGAIANEGPLVIGAGSEIDPPVLRKEIKELEECGFDIRGRLHIDQEASLISEAYHRADAVGIGTGTTGKGVSTARAERAMRKVTRWSDLMDHDPRNLKGEDTSHIIRGWLENGGTAIIEGTQGFALGSHAGFYPYCTSSDCRAVDFCAMAGVSPWDAVVDEFEVWVVARIYPIRIAGNSGPLANEKTWEALGLPEEYTTVTKKVRRVGGWDNELVNRAISANGGAPTVKVALTMVDHLVPWMAGKTEIPPSEGDTGEDLFYGDLKAHGVNLDAQIRMVGTGPKTVMWT